VLTDTTGVTTWTYDALGRMTGVSDPFTGTVVYGYDAVSNRTALTVTMPNSELRIANYEFDAANRLIQVSDWATGTTTYGYDAAGRILTTTLPNGVNSVYDYDAAGRQVGLQHAGITETLATYTYTLDALGRQVAVTESLRAGVGLTVTTRVISHTFDGAGRLSHSAYSTGEAFTYQYDAAGNRTVVTGTTPLSGTVVTTNSYDAANRLTARSRSDGHSYTYDWSPRGQLLTEWTQGYPVRAFVYDGAGRMIQARVFTQTTEFVYNGLGARLAVSVEGYGTTLYTLDYAAGNRILAETTPTETVSYLYGHECLGEQREGEWLYYLHDAEGYVRQGADAEGNMVSAWLFDPDGTVLEGPNGPVSHLICGGVYDWSTGLIYRGGRYFDPNLGIWLALMPLMVVQGWKQRRRRRQWVLLVCVGLFVVGSLAGCGPEGQPPLTVCLTPTPIPGLGPGTGTPTPLIGIVTRTPGSPPTRGSYSITPGPIPTPTFGPSPTPPPSSTPSNPCWRGGSYAACFNSPPCALTGGIDNCTGIMDFYPGDKVDQEKLTELIIAIKERLSNANPPISSIDARRVNFDTPFHNITLNPTWDLRLSYLGTEYRRSEVNYIGQGVWGAIVGESLDATLTIVKGYKATWGETPTEGVTYWTTYGYHN